jgi:uncharacterized protein with HEPN domain
MRDINKIKIIKRIDFIKMELQDLRKYENINYDQLSEIARMRNILAHQYLDIRWGIN